MDEENPIYDSRDNSNAVIETSTNTLLFGCKNTTISSSVVKIDSNAFLGTIGLKSLTIPDDSCLKEIGSRAFLETEIEAITFPSSLEKINDYAFYNCKKLASITFNTGLREIGYYCFYGSSVESIFIPESLQYIESGAFAYCNNLNSIVVDDNNQYLRSEENSNSIVQYHISPNGEEFRQLIVACNNTKLYEGINVIREESFMGLEGIREIILPNSVYKLQETFSLCNKIITDLIIGDGIEIIDAYSFAKCTNLINVVLPNTLKTIRDYAFCSCAISSISFPSSLKTIGNYAFTSCFNLNTMLIPDSIQTLGSGALWDAVTPLAQIIPQNTRMKKSQNSPN